MKLPGCNHELQEIFKNKNQIILENSFVNQLQQKDKIRIFEPHWCPYQGRKPDKENLIFFVPDKVLFDL